MQSVLRSSFCNPRNEVVVAIRYRMDERKRKTRNYMYYLLMGEYNPVTVNVCESKEQNTHSVKVTSVVQFRCYSEDIRTVDTFRDYAMRILRIKRVFNICVHSFL